MKLLNRSKKAIRFFRKNNVWQTWQLNRRIKHPASSTLCVKHYSMLNIDKTAQIILHEQSHLHINEVMLEGRSRVEPATLYMYPKSRFVVDGFVTMFEGAAVVLFEGGLLEVGDETRIRHCVIQCGYSPKVFSVKLPSASSS